MQILLPYREPIEIARCLDRKRLRRQIVDCRQILRCIDKKKFNHPVVRMYKDHRGFVENYMFVMECHKRHDDATAEFFSTVALCLLPSFITDEFINHHRSRLYTKDSSRYGMFSEYGTSHENWYIVDGNIVKHKGKEIK